MNSAVIKVMVSYIIKIVTFPLRVLPIRKNRILFTGLTGGNVYDYSCNPKYLYEYIRDNYAGQFEIVWIVKDISKYPFLKEEGVKLVKHFTVSSFPMLLTSNIVITNGSYTPWFPFRKSQYVINTWHGGGAYKKVENDKPDANWATKKRAEICANNIDLFLASCRTQEEKMIRETFLYKGEVLRAGTPRNDFLINGNVESMREKVRKQYHIPKEGKIILYAPTYRITSVPVTLNADALLENIQILDKENHKWFFMSRFHRYQDESMNIQVIGKNVIDVVNYPDMQELLSATDLFITDYSSSVWDYSILKRPCFLYVPDKDAYTKTTGFYVDLQDWPFKQAKDMEELIQNIKEYSQVEETKEIEQHLKNLGSYENGNACKTVVEKILQHCSLD